jgi:hypothetical protein
MHFYSTFWQHAFLQHFEKKVKTVHDQMLFCHALLQRDKKSLFDSIFYEHLDDFLNFFFHSSILYNLVNNKPEQAQSTAN